MGMIFVVVFYRMEDLLAYKCHCRHCLWILGNGRTLLNSDSVWATLVNNAKERNCFFQADEDKDLGKAILQAKKKLDQLNDLLKADSILFKSARWKVMCLALSYLHRERGVT